jgi:hypothetical protein
MHAIRQAGEVRSNMYRKEVRKLYCGDPEPAYLTSMLAAFFIHRIEHCSLSEAK